MLKSILLSLTAFISLQAATTYNKSLSDGNSNLNYWSDTTSSNLTNHTLVGATEVFTLGSRYNIPNVPTPIKVSTNKLCSNDKLNLLSCYKTDSLEPRYTDDGLATSGESNLRTWYKATTPKSVNGVVDDPCTSLSNTGSVVNWWSDFGNIRCERIITTYTPKVNSTIYTPKIDTNSNYNSSLSRYTFPSPTGLYTGGNQNRRLTTLATPYGNITMQSNASVTASINGQFLFNIVSGVAMGPTYNYSTTYNGMNIKMVSNCSYGSSGGHSWSKVSIVGGYIDSYSCPSGGYLSGTNCIRTTPICPDASWFSATATTCSKVIQVCPDASWIDNGVNCKKNIPEYKLFSTF